MGRPQTEPVLRNRGVQSKQLKTAKRIEMFAFLIATADDDEVWEKYRQFSTRTEYHVEEVARGLDWVYMTAVTIGIAYPLRAVEYILSDFTHRDWKSKPVDDLLVWLDPHPGLVEEGVERDRPWEYLNRVRTLWEEPETISLLSPESHVNHGANGLMFLCLLAWGFMHPIEALDALGKSFSSPDQMRLPTRPNELLSERVQGDSLDDFLARTAELIQIHRSLSPKPTIPGEFYESRLVNRRIDVNRLR